VGLDLAHEGAELCQEQVAQLDTLRDGGEVSEGLQDLSLILIGDDRVGVNSAVQLRETVDVVKGNTLETKSSFLDLVCDDLGVFAVTNDLREGLQCRDSQPQNVLVDHGLEVSDNGGDSLAVPRAVEATENGH